MTLATYSDASEAVEDAVRVGLLKRLADVAVKAPETLRAPMLANSAALAAMWETEPTAAIVRPSLTRRE
jgi:hypothetical protein